MVSFLVIGTGLGGENTSTLYSVTTILVFSPSLSSSYVTIFCPHKFKYGDKRLLLTCYSECYSTKEKIAN